MPKVAALIICLFRKRGGVTVFMLALCSALFVRGAAEAAVLRVPHDFRSVQTAVDKALPGDTVHVSSGRYRENIRLRPGVILQGDGSGTTIIEGNGGDSVVEGANGAVIEGFTITGSGKRWGGGVMDAGIFCESAPMTIANNRIIGNNTGIALYSSPSNIVNNEISGSAVFGLYQAYSDSLVSNNVIYGNSSYGVYSSYSNSDIVNNTIAYNLGGVLAEASRGIIKNNIFYSNSSGGLIKRTDPNSGTKAEPALSHNLFWSNNEARTGFKPQAGDIVKDPAFASPQHYDFHLKPSSPALKGGENGEDIGGYGGRYAQKSVPLSVRDKTYAGLKDRSDKLKEAEARAALKASLAAARWNFESYCASCHGQRGRGDGNLAFTLDVKPSNLTDKTRLSAQTDELIFKVIKDGGSAAGLSESMLSFNSQLNEEDIKNLVRFIRLELCKCRHEGQKK